jgi:hypothetical protein
MKKFILTTCVAALCVASAAMAQDEISLTNGLGLGWTACSATNPVGALNVTFACDLEATNACRVFRLMPTFVSTLTDSRFAGSITTIDVLVGSSPTVGLWWSGLVPGACRAVPAISTPGNITATVCANPYPSGSGTLPGQQVAANTGQNPLPNRFRISSANSVNPTQSLTTGVRTYAMQLEFKTEGTLADCDPTLDNTPICTDGCTTPACFVCNQVDLFMAVDGNPATPDIIHYTSDGSARNNCTYAGGTGANCPGATPAKQSTWGGVKALYR